MNPFNMKRLGPRQANRQLRIMMSEDLPREAKDTRNSHYRLSESKISVDPNNEAKTSSRQGFLQRDDRLSASDHQRSLIISAGCRQNEQGRSMEGEK